MPPRVAAFAAIVFWGISFVATKAALREISPVTLIFTRFAIGAGLLLGITRMRGGNPLPPRETWGALAIMGFFGVFVHQMIQSFALTMTTAMHTGWLIGVTPIWSALLSAGTGKERFGVVKVACLAGGFGGALLVVSRGKFGQEFFGLPSTRGDLLILLSTINWAIYTVLGHGTIKKLGASRATAGSMLLGWLMLAPIFCYQAGWREWPNLTMTGWGSVLFLGICCSALGYLFWYGALERIEVSKVAAFLYIEPLVTLIAAMVVLQESASATTIVGGLVVLLSVFVLQRAQA